MTDCHDCAEARTTYPHAGYRLACKECAARMAAQSPAYFASEMAHRILPEYRAVLAGIGVENIGTAHMMARAWRKVLDELQGGVIDGAA